MTFRENAAVLETYLHNIRNIEEVPPGPMELEGCGNRGYESCSRECRVRSICLGQAERYVCSDRQASTSKAVVFETIPGESKKRRDTELDRSGEVQDFGENGRRDCKRLEGGKG